MTQNGSAKEHVRGLYGRQKGKKLGPYQRELMDNYAPRFALNTLRQIDLKSEFQNQHTEFQLEIGFGGGEHIAHLATLNPHIGYLACEPFENGVAKLVRRCIENNINNIKIHQGNAMDIVALLPDQCLSRIYILYPDPWPKWRHRKRRIINVDHLQQCARILKDGSELRFATDIDDYSAWTLQRILKNQLFKWNVKSPHDWLQPWPDWVRTRYEEKAINEQRQPAYYRFIKYSVSATAP
jgi:tRNA (guanine-N7-)-methyltransferase